MKVVNLIIAFVVVVWLALFGWGAWRVYEVFAIGRDPLRAEKLELQRAEILRETEKERQKTEEQRRETLREQARIERQTKLESNAGVSWASVVLAFTWRMSFPILFFSGVIGAGVYLYRKPVLFEHGTIRSPVPRHEAAPLTREALAIEERRAMVEALAYCETVTQGRVEQIISTVKALKPGRENISINQSALPAAAETQPQQGGNVPTFQQAVKDFQAGSVLVGYDSTRQPAYIPLENFVSCAFGGGSGSGKTSKLRFLVAQLILQGVNVSILDAHAGNEQSLADSLGNLANMPNVRIFNPFETAQAVYRLQHLQPRSWRLDAAYNAMTEYNASDSMEVQPCSK